MQAAIEAFDLLTAPPGCPQRLQNCAHRTTMLGPQRVALFRAQQLSELQSQSRLLADRSKALLASAAPHAQKVLSAASPSGPNLGLLEWCLNEIGWHDDDLILHLQHGFPLIGAIPADAEAPRSEVRSQSFNQQQLESLGSGAWHRQLRRHSESKSDFDDSIWSQTVEEVALGRMSALLPAATQTPGIVTRRFGVSQVDSKGRSKVRCIDDFKESLINDACSVDRRIRMGRIDDLQSVVRTLAMAGEPLHLLKSDFKAAYRSLPISSSHLGLSSIILRDPFGQVFVSTQWAMPFGAVASVYAWDRLGAALAAILQHFLLIPCARYVDDLFWADFEASASAGRQAALDLISLLGFTLEESKTPAPSQCQNVLGIQITLLQQESAMKFSPDPLKAGLWVSEIQHILNGGGPIDLVHFRTLTGRLGFAAWAIWGASSRCHLSGLHYQVRTWSTALSSQATADLQWWLDQLERMVALVRPITFPHQPPLILYTDASGDGGLGAFLMDGEPLWVSGRAPVNFGKHLKPRRTQICVYETLMVVCAFRIFAQRLQGRRVVIFVDNRSALGALRKGTSSSWDLRVLVELFWQKVAECHCYAFFRYIPSKLNIADWPSREKPAAIGVQIPWRPRFEPILAALTTARSLIQKKRVPALCRCCL